MKIIEYGIYALSDEEQNLITGGCPGVNACGAHGCIIDACITNVCGLNGCGINLISICPILLKPIPITKENYLEAGSNNLVIS
jgi:hypothetical protein